MHFFQVLRRWFGYAFAFLGSLLLIHSAALLAQTGTSGTITGVIKDPSGAVVANAAITINDPVSGYTRTISSGNMGDFTFGNVPFNPYHMTIAAPGFANYTQDVDVRSPVPVKLEIALKLGTTSATVTVTENAADILEVEPTDHTDVDRGLFDKLPLESPSSSLSSLVTLASPGVSADSNGLFHGLGDHAENSFSIDGQPITDQQSKVFSNQLPVDAIQSIEVIDGAPPAEYGGKTSLVIDATTRSGLGTKQPTGEVVASYGSFGTGTGGFNLGWGGDKWGNFLAANGLNTNRFLDPPEFTVMHAGGDQQNVFDRVDYKFTQNNTLSLDVNFTRSWFQTPNSYDAQFASAWNGVVVDNGGIGPDGKPVPLQNQRSKIDTLNIAPSFTHVINSSALFTLSFFTRGDQYTYSPSQDPFADLTPDLQGQSIAQYRSLTNIGGKATFSYVKGAHNVKVGFTDESTLLHEADSIGIVDPTANPLCLNSDGSLNTSPGITSQSQCGGPLNLGGSATPLCSSLTTFAPGCFTPLLGCYDLTRTAPLPGSDGCPTGQTTSSYYSGFDRKADIRESALYAEDSISFDNINLNLGVRGDFYNGLASHNEAEPRVGIAYNIKKTNSVLRISYAHTLESPFNENLILSSTGCNDAVVADLMLATQLFPCTTAPLSPGIRNEYHAGLQQAFGKFFVLDGEYIWKYTHLGYDFNTLGATPITLPIEWYKSKIPGFTVRGSFPGFHGLSAFIVMSSVAARFFPAPFFPGTVAGIGPVAPPGVFRIDHDERFNQTTHLQYQPSKFWPWIGFNWRYDSGLVAGATPCYNPEAATCAGASTTFNGAPAISMLNTITGAPLSPDQEFQAGFTCNGVHAAPPSAANPAGTPISYMGQSAVCPASLFGSTLIAVPAPGTENDDHNPQRIAPRNLFDLSLGDDDLFHHWRKSERYTWSAKFTVVNLGNADVLYNFLSTFSGTHYVTPRTETVELGFHF
jgi:carboxypeptidase family protein/TonB-dependent receptor-like protein